MDKGFRTTKSVWPTYPWKKSNNGITWTKGSTLEDEDYVFWLKELYRAGFELGFHSNTSHPSVKREILSGLDLFYNCSNHVSN